MDARILFKNGRRVDKPLSDAEGLISEVKSARVFIKKLKVNDLLDYFQKLSLFWLADNKMLLRYPHVKALAQFIRRDNLADVLEISLRGNLKALDSFETLPIGSSRLYYHCQPRGLVVHWLAGNASLLGFYSLFQAMITKNVSIVKPSSRSYQDFLDVLKTVGNVHTAKIHGKDLLKSVAVVLVDRNDIDLQTKLSQNADVRIAWGGKDAIESISSLPKSVYTEDIMLGPKYSFGIIDKESLVDYKKITARLALDISTFDQHACSSPHTIFIEKDKNITPVKFASALANSLEYVGKKLIRKNPADTRKNLDILTLRAKYNMVGRVWSSSDTEWTVILSDEKGLSPACASRVIFVRPIASLKEIASFMDRGNQTIGVAMNNKKQLDLFKKIAFGGGDRFVPFGRMTFFDLPWDGMFMADRLIRWVSCYNKNI